MIWALTIFILSLTLKLAIDLRLYQSGKKNRHSWGAAFAAAVIIACTWLAGWKTAGIWAFGWWSLFNILFNLLIGQKWDYIGTTSKLDILEGKYPVIKYLRFFGLATSIAFYLIKTGVIK